MQISGISPGDIVLVDKKGRIFHAEVEEKNNGGLIVKPLQKGITYGTAKSTEVKSHWKKAKR